MYLHTNKAIEVPESKGLFVMILLADLLDNIMREIILLSAGDVFTSAVASVVLSGAVVPLFFGALALTYFIYLCVVKAHCTKYISSIVQTVGAFLYFYGDNLPHVLHVYGDALGCDSTCQRRNIIGAITSLTLALIVFQFAPLVLHKLYQLVERKDEENAKQSPWFLAIEMITILVKIDALYSGVSAMVESGDFCDDEDVNAASVVLITTCIICGIVTVVLYGVYALCKNKNNGVYIGLTVLTIVLLALCFPLYMIADNRQPLDCALKCDMSAFQNQTSSCERIANSGIRLGFIFSTLLIITILSLVFFGCAFISNKKQLMYPV